MGSVRSKKINNLPCCPVISRIFPFSARPGRVKETFYRNDPSSTLRGVNRQRLRVCRAGRVVSREAG